MGRIVVILSLGATLFCAVGCRSRPHATDLLAQVRARGTLIVSTDPNYRPQSSLRADGHRTPGTHCADDQLTAGELEGFDVDVAVEIGHRLGVEACFVSPDWDLVTAGNWGGRWDISVGSMAITNARRAVLDFSVPYYYTPAQFAVATSAGIHSTDQLVGQSICVGTATTYESWLEGDVAGLGLPAESIHAVPPPGIHVVPLSADQECPQAIAAGRTDFVAYLTSRTVVDQNIAAGIPVTRLGDCRSTGLAPT
jgi:polar amino acid transport system substrate-binding protein